MCLNGKSLMREERLKQKEITIKALEKIPIEIKISFELRENFA